MSGWNFDSQQTPAELTALIEHLLLGSGHETSILEQHDIPPDAFPWYFIRSQSLSQFLQGCALAEHPPSGSGHETDQHHNGTSTHAHSWFCILSQDLYQFLQHDAFGEYPSFGCGNETPVEQNGMPNDAPSWLIPVASLHQFLQPFAHPISESLTFGGGHDIPDEQNGTLTYGTLLLIPAESLDQFLQLYEISEPPSFDSRHETCAEQQLEDVSEDDAMSASVTPTQSQDSDQVGAQPNEATTSISYVCPVCTRPFTRVQDRNRHIESYFPHSISCPSQGCFWTGRRESDFKAHWKKKHSEDDQVPAYANELYDPRTFVEMVLRGTPVYEVARDAFTEVQESLKRLGKGYTRANVLGRKKNLRTLIRDPSTLIPPSFPD